MSLREWFGLLHGELASITNELACAYATRVGVPSSLGAGNPTSPARDEGTARSGEVTPSNSPRAGVEPPRGASELDEAAERAHEVLAKVRAACLLHPADIEVIRAGLRPRAAHDWELHVGTFGAMVAGCVACMRGVR